MIVEVAVVIDEPAVDTVAMGFPSASYVVVCTDRNANPPPLAVDVMIRAASLYEYEYETTESPDVLAVPAAGRPEPSHVL